MASRCDGQAAGRRSFVSEGLGAAAWLLSALAAALWLGVPEARAQAPQVCFAEGSDPSLSPPLPQAAQAEGAAQAASFSGRWGATATNGTTGVKGDPIVLTWGVVDDGTNIVAAFDPPEASGPSNLQASLDALFAGQGGRAAWMALFQEVFDRWDAASGIRFVHELADDGVEIRQSASFKGALGTRPDIRISGHAIDGNSQIVAYAYPPVNGDIVLDTNDSFYFDAGDDYLHLRNALSHEIGHALGLQHTCPESQEKLMEPTVGGFLDGPQADDIIGVTQQYGDALENDDSPGGANDYGLPVGDSVAILDMSIDGTGDEDWSVIPDVPGLRVSVTVNPQFYDAYLFSEPNSGGPSCADGSGAVIDPDVVQDLAIQLVAADGATEIVFRDFSPAGGVEQLTQYPVSGGGYLRIVGDGAGEAQLYDLSVQFIPEPSGAVAAMAALWTLARLRRAGRVPRP